MFKKRTAIATIIMSLVIITGLLPGCTPSESPVQTTPTPAAGIPKPTTTSGPIKLRYGTADPATVASTKMVIEYLAPEIERRTNGMVTIEIYTDGALGKKPAQYESIRTGVIDLGPISISDTPPGKFQLFEVGFLPSVYDDHVNFAYAMMEMYSRGWFDKEFSEIKIFGIYSGPPYHLAMKSHKVMDMTDMKGLKIRCSGAQNSATVEKIGAVPVSLATTETYLSMQRGIIDGAMCPAYWSDTFKLTELIKYFAEVNLGGFNYITAAMSMSAWEQLPDDIKVALADLPMDFTIIGSEALVRQSKAAYANMAKAGVEVYTWSPDVKEKVLEAVLPVVDGWVNEKIGAGVRATEFMKELHFVMERRGMNWLLPKW